jgi:hypothetical protein
MRYKIMEEKLNQRKIELESVAKNTIIEIYLIEDKKKEIKLILEAKRKYLQNINASINEIEYLSKEDE